MNLTKFSYENEIFANLIIPWEQIFNKEFSECKFEKCDFSQCDFSWCIFVDCVFVNCNLSNIKIQDAWFQVVTFLDCKILWVSFDKISTFLLDWEFKNSSISLCSFNKLNIKNTKFIDCKIGESDFVACNLSGCDFSGTDLHLARFQWNNLEKADLKTAINYVIDPTDNKVKWASFAYPEVLGLLNSFWIKVE